MGTMVGSASASRLSTLKIPGSKIKNEIKLEEDDSVDQPILLSTKQIINN
tara:strand:+ start:1269 stop:1418 length:150 start_codon:yes stop_codon:yes gene_type:complete